MNTLEKLVTTIDDHKRLMMKVKNPSEVDTRQKAWILYRLNAEDMVTTTYGQILTNLERQSELANTLSSIGGALYRLLLSKRKELKLSGEDDDFLEELTKFIRANENAVGSVETKEVHLGWFLFQAYLDVGVLALKLKQGKKKGSNSKKKKHTSYHITVSDLEGLHSIMDLVKTENVEMFPSPEAPAPWQSGKFLHASGYAVIKKKPHKDAIAQVKLGEMDYVLDALNKLGSTGWRINSFIFDVFKKSKVHQGNSPFKAMKEVDPEKRASLLIELQAIEKLAERNKERAFYHLYNCDFRGRIYPNTAFLHEQSSDNAKGLLLLDKPVPLGEEGLYWLLVHTANMFGNDKVSLDDRAQFVQDNWQTYMDYVADPFSNDDWMNADKPLCFLACCYELYMLQNFVEEGLGTAEEFPSCLPIYIDGSNNGVQHLAAMSKDEVVAPLVNLVPQELPGDVYMFIADKTMVVVDALDKKTPKKVSDRFDEVFDKLVELKDDVAKYSTNPSTKLYKESYARLQEYKNQTYELKKGMGPIFWNRIKDRKTWRKTVKRPVMTLGYGGTAHGMVDMVEDDTRSLSNYLRDKDYSWSVFLGHLIYNTCKKELKGPAQMLDMFENLGMLQNEKEKHVAYKQVITGFPFVQVYVETKTKQLELYYNDQLYRISVAIRKSEDLNKSKQKQSTAPNIVHSVDAAHLTMVIHEADYPVTVVHDSFGCHAGNMSHMFKHVRDQFVELYKEEPLEHIFNQMDALHLIPQKGNLDVTEVINSDYAFA